MQNVATPKKRKILNNRKIVKIVKRIKQNGHGFPPNRFGGNPTYRGRCHLKGGDTSAWSHVQRT